MPPTTDLFFHIYPVARQVFFRSKLSYGIVNLRPLIAGHVLICPVRKVPRLSQLHPEEVTDLFLAVQRVGKVIEKVYGGEGLTVSCQDGAAAGQSVPHVHVHVLPRKTTDFGGNNDEIYPALETSEHALEGDLKAVKGPDRSAQEGDEASKRKVLEVPKDEDRRCRSEEEMEEEARWLEGFFEDDKDLAGGS